MSLPDTWIDRIFEKLTLVYGVDFMNRWKGLDVAEVKADWAHELAGYQQRPDAIAHALRTLPTGKPPTVLEFRELARKAPASTRDALPPAPASPDVLRQELHRLDAIRRESLRNDDPKAWARKLIARHESGGHVRPKSLELARQALMRTDIKEAA